MFAPRSFMLTTATVSIRDDTDAGRLYDDYDDDIDVYARGQLKVVGKTDTAVGEVGVQMRHAG